jgi:hypothetical protein
MHETITTDLSKFGWRGWELLRDILNAMLEHGVPEDFDGDGMKPMFNMNSGNVFLTNDEHQVAMMNGESLESFYSCPECGYEGFMADMEAVDDGYGAKQCCADYVKSV